MASSVAIRSEAAADVGAIAGVTTAAFATLEISNQTEPFIIEIRRRRGAGDRSRLHRDRAAIDQVHTDIRLFDTIEIIVESAVDFSPGDGWVSRDRGPIPVAGAGPAAGLRARHGSRRPGDHRDRVPRC